MKPMYQEYKGHRIEIREHDGESDLLIDGARVRYGQLPQGKYYLHEYAYDWSDDLLELAQKFIDHRHKADNLRRERALGKEGD